MPGEPQDHALGYSRGGFTTKIHLVTDGNGTPLVATLTAGQRHESTEFEHALQAVPIGPGPDADGPHEDWPKALSGDKGYSYPAIREWLDQRAIQDVIPTRSDQPRDETFDRELYRRRNVVERCVGWLKECRRVLTRFEKYAVHYLAMIKLAIIRRYLKLKLSDST